jgi:hypothetical protein
VLLLERALPHVDYLPGADRISKCLFEIDSRHSGESTARDHMVQRTLRPATSICTAIIAINTIRLAIGLGSLAMTVGAGAILVRFHADWIRIPMLTAATVGSVLNLTVLAHIRHLRKRPASLWRQKPVARETKKREREQFFLSSVSLVLVGVEEYFHYLLCHKL